MYLLDTNVVSEMRRGERANAAVVRWAQSNAPTGYFLSAVTILEAELGARLIQRRDHQQATVLMTWVEKLVAEFDGKILPMDTAVARRTASLHVPDPRPERDAMIGATALVHDLIVVTRNIADFRSMGVRVLNPWDGAP